MPILWERILCALVRSQGRGGDQSASIRKERERERVSALYRRCLSGSERRNAVFDRQLLSRGNDRYNDHRGCNFSLGAERIPGLSNEVDRARSRFLRALSTTSMKIS